LALLALLSLVCWTIEAAPRAQLEITADPAEGPAPLTTTLTITLVNNGDVALFDEAISSDAPGDTPLIVGGDSNGNGSHDPGERFTWVQHATFNEAGDVVVNAFAAARFCADRACFTLGTLSGATDCTPSDAVLCSDTMRGAAPILVQDDESARCQCFRAAAKPVMEFSKSNTKRGEWTLINPPTIAGTASGKVYTIEVTTEWLIEVECYPKDYPAGSCSVAYRAHARSDWRLQDLPARIPEVEEGFTDGDWVTATASCEDGKHQGSTKATVAYKATITHMNVGDLNKAVTGRLELGFVSMGLEGACPGASAWNMVLVVESKQDEARRWTPQVNLLLSDFDGDGSINQAELQNPNRAPLDPNK
jgi:hypothetical protein